MFNRTNGLEIDIDLSMYLDTPIGKDPDAYSKKLNLFHQILWSKVLPNGEIFILSSSNKAPYSLSHKSSLGDITLSSDGIIHPYSRWKRMHNVIKLISKEEIDYFIYIGSTIGAYIVFPSYRVENKSTINIMRGMHPFVNDRFDLTLECIRRWYLDLESPLYEHLNRYSSFFKLFLCFEEYIDYFLLNDLISEDYKEIKFWLPFDGFGVTSPLPRDEKEYRMYMSNAIDFVQNRNKRIINWSKSKI